MKRRAILIISLVGLVALIGGCGTAIGEGAALALGASGSATPIQEVSADLGVYQRFELGTITDDMGGKVPPGLFTALPGELAKELDDEEIPNAASGKTLLIQGKILHYEGASSAAVATSGTEFVVARIELVDKDTGQVLGVASCAGWSSKRVTLGVDRKAEGLAKGIVNWIDKHHPLGKTTKK
ncbi:MAG: hypothetical protein K8R91_01430 [Phycisphaerae bacterium]|nr:hypothetical protein [Phycisphaerae bacterium]